MKMFMCFCVLLSFASGAWAQTPAPMAKPKTIYQYKKYESFDMGSLDLEGELLAPGDVTVRERDRAKIKMDLFDRKRMSDFKRKDAQSIK